jgi:MOSC domain-containing protein YiiM
VAHVVSIAYTPAGIERKPPDWYGRVAISRAVLVEGHGIEGDLKGGRGKRQLNVMRAETLAELSAQGRKVGQGEMGEQLVFAGMDAASLVPGSRLRLGATAVIEVTIPRTGCDRFEHIQGTTKESVEGMLGVIARVVTGGEVRIGETVAPMADQF